MTSLMFTFFPKMGNISNILREKVVMTSLMFTFFPKMGNISNILRKNVVYKKDVDTFA